MNQRTLDKWHYRHGTADEIALRHTYYDNHYHLPDDMQGRMIVDVGAHIGTFAVACAERGGRVVAYEPFPDSYALLVENTAKLPVSCRQYALGEKYGTTDLYIHTSNTGGNSTVLDDVKALAGGEIRVTTIPIEAMLTEAILNTGRVDWLKLDCEGAEIYAIATVERWHEVVTNLVMEFHTPRQIELRERLLPYFTPEWNFQGEWGFKHK